MAVYFCSDPHAFHGNILKFCRRLRFMTEDDRAAFLALEAEGRSYDALRMSDESVATMNRALADAINRRVGLGDELWCLGDWAFGRGGEYLRNARWFREQIACRAVHLVWGNHDDPKIRDLFASTHDQIQLKVGQARITLNHYPMLTWPGQHHGSVREPNVHLYGHVHGLYQREPAAHPLRDAAAWPALDVGFDAHDYEVWSLDEVLDELRPRLAAFEALRRERNQFDPFRGRGHAASVHEPGRPALRA